MFVYELNIVHIQYYTNYSFHYYSIVVIKLWFRSALNNWVNYVYSWFYSEILTENYIWKL